MQFLNDLYYLEKSYFLFQNFHVNFIYRLLIQIYINSIDNIS